jgi:CBS domain-containing protein
MQVKDTMTSAVIGVAESATLWEALQTLLGSKLSALVVFDPGGAPVGVLSEGDLLRRAELGTQKLRPVWLDFLIGGGRAAEDYAHSHGRRVGDIMTRGIISIGEEAELSDAVDLMLKHKIKRIVVMRGGKAVGILSRSDLLKALMGALPDASAKRTDAQIQAAVEAEVDRQQWAPRGSITISVADGIVTYEGAISDDRLRDGLRVLAENIPGVKKVRDRLAWIEPNSGILIPFSEETDD